MIIDSKSGLCQEAGWEGIFTRKTAEGCKPAGTRAYKTSTLPGDSHQDGAPCTVLGSLSHPDVGTAYFVEWDDKPKHACAIVAHRLRFD